MQTFRNLCLFLVNLSFCVPSLYLYAQTTVPTVHVVTLGAYDRGDRLVAEVKPDQIRIKGLPAKVRHVELNESPRRIILLLDTSGSMGNYETFGGPMLTWSDAAQTAIQFVLRRQGEDLIELDTFSDKHQILVPFTTDSQFLVRRIEGITNSGKGRTFLGQALAEILASRPSRLRFGDAIVLVSDGEYTLGDKVHLWRLRDEFICAGVRVFLLRVPPMLGYGATLGVGDAADFVTEIGGVELRMSGSRVDQRLAPLPVGNLNPQTINLSAETVYDFVRTLYRVELEVSDPIRKPHKFTLELLDQQGRKMKQIKLNYPRYLLPPCAQP